MNHTNVYKGIVVDAEDPLGAGRVKVFVPQVNMALVEEWNKKLDEDKMFRSIGDSCGTGISEDIHKRLREALPWAQVMGPILGPGTNGRWIPSENNSSSELVKKDSEKCETEGSGAATANSNDATAARGSEKQGTDDAPQRITPAYPDGPFTSSDYGNKAKASFSNIRENAKVYVIFEKGDPHYPIIIGLITTIEDHSGAKQREEEEEDTSVIA